ncbi:EGF-type aspartate/asparagine hydroxylation site domain containing protein [Dorcoceras hygrometricum]|uniref:EGF-type aspartate/asparagine hydroxylation site domain containing protein n=1 Tax=Dorcoceras hygrometricum TaxID=472368 RepID=A0A2Z7CZY2_9LAMI|nr:EGF-type aspartate/asparagine hydroxylation site domain containing protein [Dorcoceras hygrometricum]
MTSSYMLEEAMSSKDDVSNQQLSQSYQQLSRKAQELDSAMITSAVSSSHSEGSYSDQQFVYRAVNSLCVEEWSKSYRQQGVEDYIRNCQQILKQCKERLLTTVIVTVNVAIDIQLLKVVLTNIQLLHKYRTRQRSLQKKGHKGRSLSVLSRTHLNGKNFVSNGFNLNRGYLKEEEERR